MSSKSKEEDRIEMLIRGLLKLPPNRRCINCNSLGPQYVCTTFWTFVCTNCSGLHREFTHRVKSVSMSKFNLDEVNALQSGGNERAKEIYFKTWDPVRNFFPDNSNIHRLRDFIKSVYVDRRFTGDNNLGLVERGKQSDKDGAYESTSGSSDEKSFFSDRSLDRYGRHSYNEARSGGFLSEKDRYRMCRRGSSRFESTDSGYRYQVDESRIVGRSATQMFTTADLKQKSKSPDGGDVRDSNSPLPPVRHVRELLGDNFVALRIEESVNVTPNGQFGDHPKGVNTSAVDNQDGNVHSRTNHKTSVSACGRNDESGSEISDNNAEAKPNSEIPGSFSTCSQDPSNPKQEQKSSDASMDGGKSDSAPTKETSRYAPPKNTLEFLLFELSTPPHTTPKHVEHIASTAPSHSSLTLPQSSVTMPSPHPGLSKPPTLETVPALPSNGGDSSDALLALTLPDARDPSSISTSTSLTVQSDGTIKCEKSRDVGASPQRVLDLFGVDISTVEKDHRNQPFSVPQPEICIAIDSDSSSSSLQTYRADQPTDNQSAALALVPCGEMHIASSAAQNPHVDHGSTLETKSAVITHSSRTEARSDDGRKELPANLFTSPYPPCPAVPFPGWQMGPSFSMQHLPAPMYTPTIQEVAKSRNPFDINDNTTAQHHIPTFPSSTSFHGGGPNVSAPQGMMIHNSSFGSLVPSFPPTQTASYPAGAYMGQQLYNNSSPSSRQQGVGGIAASMNPMNPNPYDYSGAATPTTPTSSFSTSTRNPFG